MDQLIWSVQPKDTQDDRKKLATIVPPLIKRLGAGLDVAGVEHEVREFFFDALMKAHTHIMSQPLRGKDGSNAAHAAPVATPAAALDFTAAITVKNPYGGGEVKVSAAELDADDDLDSLKQGDWMEFRTARKEDDTGTGKEERRPARLIFISPRKTRYILSLIHI